VRHEPSARQRRRDGAGAKEPRPQRAHYDRQIAFFERVLFGDGRRWVGQQAHGQVLELAVGTARNLPYYPDDVTLTGIELSPKMLALGRRRAQELGRPA
jgi:SAM-dependent methyltransferase